MDGENNYGSVYYKMAKTAHKTKMTVTVLLFVFMALMTAEYYRGMTFQNLFNMYMDVNSERYGDEEIKDMTVGSVGKKVVIGNRAAVISQDGVTVYSPSGDVVYDSPFDGEITGYSVSGDYLAVFSDARFAVYSSSQKIYGSGKQRKIIAVCVNSNGMCAVSEQRSETRGIVELFDGNGNHVANYYKNEYVTGISLSENTIAFLCVDRDGNAQISSAGIGSQTFSYTLTVPDVKPKSVVAFGNGNSVLVTETSLVFTDKTGNITSTFGVGGMVTSYDAFGDRLCIIYKKFEESLSIMFDTNGSVIYNDKEDRDAVKIVCQSNGYAIMYIDRVVRVYTDADRIEKRGIYTDIINYSGRLLCVTGNRIEEIFAAAYAAGEK